MSDKENDFIVALLEAGAALHKEGEIIIAKGLITIKEGEDAKVVGQGSVYPKYYGFKIIKETVKEIHFSKAK